MILGIVLEKLQWQESEQMGHQAYAKPCKSLQMGHLYFKVIMYVVQLK